MADTRAAKNPPLVPIKAGPRQDVPRTGEVEIKIRLCGIWTRSTSYPFPRSDGYTIMAIAPGMGSAGQERKREPGPQRSPCPEPAIPQREGQPEPLRDAAPVRNECPLVPCCPKCRQARFWIGLPGVFINLRFRTAGTGSEAAAGNAKAPRGINLGGFVLTALRTAIGGCRQADRERRCRALRVFLPTLGVPEPPTCRGLAVASTLE
jgi:hypothetical protein